MNDRHTLWALMTAMCAVSLILIKMSYHMTELDVRTDTIIELIVTRTQDDRTRLKLLENKMSRIEDKLGVRNDLR
jgi:hypothetical protein